MDDRGGGQGDAAAAAEPLPQVKLADMFTQGEAVIPRSRTDNIFKQLDERQLTGDEQRIIDQRVALQRTLFLEYEKRERRRKVLELLEVCEDLAEETARQALELVGWREDEAVVRLANDPGFKRRALSAAAAVAATASRCTAAAPASAPPPPPSRPCTTPAGPPRPRNPGVPFIVGDKVYAGTFKGRLGMSHKVAVATVAVAPSPAGTTRARGGVARETGGGGSPASPAARAPHVEGVLLSRGTWAGVEGGTSSPVPRKLRSANSARHGKEEDATAATAIMVPRKLRSASHQQGKEGAAAAATAAPAPTGATAAVQPTEGEGAGVAVAEGAGAAAIAEVAVVAAAHSLCSVGEEGTDEDDEEEEEPVFEMDVLGIVRGEREGQQTVHVNVRHGLQPLLDLDLALAAGGGARLEDEGMELQPLLDPVQGPGSCAEDEGMEELQPLLHVEQAGRQASGGAGVEDEDNGQVGEGHDPLQGTQGSGSSGKEEEGRGLHAHMLCGGAGTDVEECSRVAPTPTNAPRMYMLVRQAEHGQCVVASNSEAKRLELALDKGRAHLGHTPGTTGCAGSLRPCLHNVQVGEAAGVSSTTAAASPSRGLGPAVEEGASIASKPWSWPRACGGMAKAGAVAGTEAYSVGGVEAGAQGTVCSRARLRALLLQATTLMAKPATTLMPQPATALLPHRPPLPPTHTPDPYPLSHPASVLPPHPVVGGGVKEGAGRRAAALEAGGEAATASTSATAMKKEAASASATAAASAATLRKEDAGPHIPGPTQPSRSRSWAPPLAKRHKVADSSFAAATASATATAAAERHEVAVNKMAATAAANGGAREAEASLRSAGGRHKSRGHSTDPTPPVSAPASHPAASPAPTPVTSRRGRGRGRAVAGSGCSSGQENKEPNQQWRGRGGDRDDEMGDSEDDGSPGVGSGGSGGA